jgi:hypothetical protein
MMAAALDSNRVEMLQALYKASESAAKILSNFATRKRDRKVVEVGRLEEILPDLTRGEIVDVFKKLAEFGCGSFLVGRRGAASRFVWDVSLRSVGKAAMGQGTVEAVSEETDEEDGPMPSIRHEFSLRPDFRVQIELPANLTAREAARLADFIRTLPFAD